MSSFFWISIPSLFFLKPSQFSVIAGRKYVSGAKHVQASSLEESNSDDRLIIFKPPAQKFRQMELCGHPNVTQRSEAQLWEGGIGSPWMCGHWFHIWKHWGKCAAATHISVCEGFTECRTISCCFAYRKTSLNLKANLEILYRTVFDWAVLVAWTESHFICMATNRINSLRCQFLQVNTHDYILVSACVTHMKESEKLHLKFRKCQSQLVLVTSTSWHCLW